jgi:hypothetical protein
MQWSRILVIGAVLCVIAALRSTGTQKVAVAQQTTQPQLLMAGYQLPTGVRYTITLANPTQNTLGDLQVSVQLPGDALFDHALETPGFTQFQGNQDGTLSWSAASFAANDVIDAFTFFLQQPAAGAFTVSAAWNGDGAGQVQAQFQPAVQAAVDTDTDVTIDAATLAQVFTPVGNTGVVIDAVSGTIPAGTVVHVHLLGADNNPDATVGDLWWCAEVEVDGLPAGTGLVLQVPARQPLPPLASISLFAQNGGQWQALSATGSVTGDGQSVAYLHQGGVIASGTGLGNQPHLPSAGTASGQAARLRPSISQINLTQAQLQLVQMMQQPNNCQVHNCQGLPPCGLGVFSPNVQSSGLTRSCSNAGGGTTTCTNTGQQCGGNVLLTASPGGPPLLAGPGHGTACTFPSMSVALGFSCTQF